MANPPTVVVAGYGPWARTEINPAAQVVAGLKERNWDECALMAFEVPVVTDALTAWVEEKLLAHRPDVWLGLGVAPGAPALRAEMVATNWRHFEVPDNSGATLDRAPVFESGPAAYTADFPNAKIVAALKAAGIPAEISFAAGTHMCNQMLYTSRHLIERHGLVAQCGFLHLPLTPEHVARKAPPEAPQASMSLALMIEATVVAIGQAIEAAKAPARARAAGT